MATENLNPCHVPHHVSECSWPFPSIPPQILEPRFSAETLALLLNIPPQKTLLRRHLATAFSTLVGPQATQEKREYANATGHVPLTTTAKVRVRDIAKDVLAIWNYILNSQRPLFPPEPTSSLWF